MKNPAVTTVAAIPGVADRVTEDDPDAVKQPVVDVVFQIAARIEVIRP